MIEVDSQKKNNKEGLLFGSSNKAMGLGFLGEEDKGIGSDILKNWAFWNGGERPFLGFRPQYISLDLGF